jgi:hypothetical protein
LPSLPWQIIGAACAVTSVLFLIYRALADIRGLLATQNSRIRDLETWRYEHSKQTESGFADLKDIRNSLQELRERIPKRSK